MDPFPEQHDLISIFETEPEVLDPDVPWFYNRLTFVTHRGSDKVTCVIEPASRILQIDWSRNGERMVTLDLNWVESLEVVTEQPVETLTARFDPNVPLESCVLQLKPSVYVRWGTSMGPT